MREDATTELHAVESLLLVGHVAWALEDSWRCSKGLDHPHPRKDAFTLRMLTGNGNVLPIEPALILCRVPLIEMALVDIAPRASAGQV